MTKSYFPQKSTSLCVSASTYEQHLNAVRPRNADKHQKAGQFFPYSCTFSSFFCCDRKDVIMLLKIHNSQIFFGGDDDIFHCNKFQKWNIAGSFLTSKHTCLVLVNNIALIIWSISVKTWTFQCQLVNIWQH